jgi:methyltransferase (TIGR00027 family)
MHENEHQVVVARSRIAAPAFTVLSVLLFPVTLLGSLIWVGKTLLTGRGSGVSRTAQGPLSIRWYMHQLGTRPDEPSHRLLLLLPGVAPVGVRLQAGPLRLSHRLTGYVPRAFRYPFEGDIPQRYETSARVTFFDTVLDRSLAEVSQLVLLGAGFDTRAFRLPNEARVHSFEVDAPRTQAIKRELLSKAGIQEDGVTFVSADFERQDWLSRLVEAGFDPGKPALFLWEGVTMLLTQEAVEATLRTIASCACGSVVAFDYLTTEVLQSQALPSRLARAALRAAGEPLKFGIESTPPSRERLAALLRSCGLALGEQRTLGQETDGKRAWGGFATALVSDVPPGARTVGS